MLVMVILTVVNLEIASFVALRGWDREIVALGDESAWNRRRNVVRLSTRNMAH
jgi:hypothetical protein